MSLNARIEAASRANHWAVIMDRGPEGVDARERLSREYPDLAAKLAVQEGMEWEYLVYARSSQFGGSFTCIARNKDVLLSHAIPVVFAKMTELGGLCAYIPAVDETVVPEIEAVLARLQPTLGEKPN